MTDDAPGGVLVAGLGSELRGDDAIGVLAARELRRRPLRAEVEVIELPGEPIALLDRCAGRRMLILLDALQSGAVPGTIRRLEASQKALPTPAPGPASTHALGLREVLELGRALGRLPPVVVVFGIEGESFSPGDTLSGAVAGALPHVLARVLAEIDHPPRGGYAAAGAASPPAIPGTSSVSTDAVSGTDVRGTNSTEQPASAANVSPTPPLMIRAAGPQRREPTTIRSTSSERARSS